VMFGRKHPMGTARSQLPESGGLKLPVWEPAGGDGVTASSARNLSARRLRQIRLWLVAVLHEEMMRCRVCGKGGWEWPGAVWVFGKHRGTEEHRESGSLVGRGRDCVLG
jgi:hypothetical protein